MHCHVSHTQMEDATSPIIPPLDLGRAAFPIESESSDRKPDAPRGAPAPPAVSHKEIAELATRMEALKAILDNDPEFKGDMAAVAEHTDFAKRCACVCVCVYDGA
jgi:hypothetical protein